MVVVLNVLAVYTFSSTTDREKVDIAIPKYTFFVIRAFLWERESQKPKNINKILRKSPAPNAWAAIIKNPDFS